MGAARGASITTANVTINETTTVADPTSLPIMPASPAITDEERVRRPAGSMHQQSSGGAVARTCQTGDGRIAAGRLASHAPDMAQQPIELILVRHLASRLAVPVFLVYFNEPAEGVLGRRFEEIQAMPFEEWTTAFAPASGPRRLAVEELPLVIALRQRVPAHRRFEITGGDAVKRSIEVSAFPITTPPERLIGAVAMFWE